MKILFFDTETTGLVNFKEIDSPDKQPRLVQFGGMISDENGRALRTFCAIVRPLGYRIPDNTVHGISNDLAVKAGLDLDYILDVAAAFLNEADVIVSHNYKFDRAVIRSEFMRMGFHEYPDEKESFCTMLASTDICQLPSKRGNGFKWPRLSEAYLHFFNEDLQDAHDALTDVIACKRVYFALRKV